MAIIAMENYTFKISLHNKQHWSSSFLVIFILNYFVNVFFSYSDALPQTIKIAGLFDDGGDPVEETAFKHAVQRLNGDGINQTHSHVSVRIGKLPAGNSFHAAEKVCKLVKEEIVAIFGPQSPEAASHVQSICDALEIPHIETRWDHQIRGNQYMINLYPYPESLSRAYRDLVEAFDWKLYIVLYENDDGLFQLEELLKAAAPQKRNLIIRKLPDNKNYRSLLKSILKEVNLTKIFIACDTDTTLEVLQQAQQVGMMSFNYSFILTTLDIHTMDLDDFKYSDANITAYRLVDPSRPELQKVLKEWIALLGRRPDAPVLYRDRETGYPVRKPLDLIDESILTNSKTIPTKTALIYDAMELLGKALHALDSSKQIHIRALDCETNDMGQEGYNIITYMKMNQIIGLTGLIQFNNTGYRTDVSLDVVKLTEEGVKKIGVWDASRNSKFNWTKIEEAPSVNENEDMDLKNRTMRVSMIMNPPFCMLRRSVTSLTGNDRYEGFSISLVEALSKKLGFKYLIHEVGDSKYGGFNKETKTWNGMIKEIMDGVADMAVADLAIIPSRQEVVDFTMPYMNLGIGILHTTPKAKPPNLFSFMSPFSLDVWASVGVSFLGVTIILFVMARLTPYEWDNPHPCIQDPDELHNQFTLLNSFWFTIGSIMQQGSDVAPKISPYEWTSRISMNDKQLDSTNLINQLTFVNAMTLVGASLFRQRYHVFPKAVSTRMIAGIWWFFTLIMVSSYTANLATFLIVQDLDLSINSLEDLAKQTRVKYGCVAGGSTFNFFKDSKYDDKRQIYKNMEQMGPSVYKSSNQEGIDTVMKEAGKYAFFMESTLISYYVERKCGLGQIGGRLDNKNYGVVLPKNSKYTSQFSSVILKLQEDGTLDSLQRKWWKEERKEGTCAVSSVGDTVSALKLANVGGVFVVLVGGCLVAIILTFVEVIWKSREMKLNQGESRFREVLKDVQFALQCRGNTKPVKKKSSVSTGTGEEMGSTPYLDLGINSYGFPKLPSNPAIATGGGWEGRGST